MLTGFGCTGTSASLPASNALPTPSTVQNAHDTRKAELSDDEDEAVWTQAAATAKQRGNEKYQRAEHQQAVQLYTVKCCRTHVTKYARHTPADTGLHLQAATHQCCYAETRRDDVKSVRSLCSAMVAGV